jgi:glycosyltransferase involved in cell wall biosynthesis
MDRYTLALEFNKVLKSENFDIVHVHFPFASSILVNLNNKLKDKMIYTVHADEYRLGLSELLKPPLVARIFSPDLYLMRRVRKSVVLNEPLKEKLVKKGIEEDRLEVIPNGVNVEDFNVSEEEVEKVRRKYGLEGIVVMFAGTVMPRKGVLQLIKAGEILNLGRDILFLIVGNLNIDREYAQTVVEYAKSKGVNAKFTGFVPNEDLKALYSACDIFVLPSLEEGHGISLTEAMASGKPLIGSNVGGIPMQIRDGWNGFLVEPGNEKQLAEKIRYLIENEKERKRMGANSRRLAEKEFSWEKIVERYLEVYEEVVI